MNVIGSKFVYFITFLQCQSDYIIRDKIQIILTMIVPYERKKKNFCKKLITFGYVFLVML